MPTPGLAASHASWPFISYNTSSNDALSIWAGCASIWTLWNSSELKNLTDPTHQLSSQAHTWAQVVGLCTTQGTTVNTCPVPGCQSKICITNLWLRPGCWLTAPVTTSYKHHQAKPPRIWSNIWNWLSPTRSGHHVDYCTRPGSSELISNW